MAPTAGSDLQIATRADIRALAQESGHCLSVYLPIRPGEPSRARVAMEEAKRKLASAGLNHSELEAFLAPLADASEAVTKEHGEATKALALFRCSGEAYQFRLPYDVTEQVCVSSSYHIVPLLRGAALQNEFYILALSQKHTRLIHCTRDTSEELVLPQDVPTNLIRFLRVGYPEEASDDRAPNGQKGTGGPHPGGTGPFGTGADSDRKDEYLYHYYNELDKRLQAFLRDRQLPMVIAGVDYEVALYHKVSEYPALVAGGVQGAADGLKGGELHARALQVLDQQSDSGVEKALAMFDKSSGDRILTEPREVARAAYDGRILHLLLAEGARRPGTFDPTSLNVSEGSEADDLPNLAALQTIAKGGDAFLLPPERVPGGGCCAALLRF